jgi:hypothetical protein
MLRVSLKCAAVAHDVHDVTDDLVRDRREEARLCITTL